MVGNLNGMIRCQNKDGLIIMKHESAALIGPFHTASLVLPPLESYRNYREPTQRGLQGYLSSLQRRVVPAGIISTRCRHKIGTHCIISHSNFCKILHMTRHIIENCTNLAS